MFELFNELVAMLEANGIPYECRGSDPQYIYFPHRVSYKLRFRQYEDDTYGSLQNGSGEWLGDCHSAQEAYAPFAKQYFKVTKTVDVVAEEIGRLQAFDDGCKALSKYARNLNLQALQGKLFRAYGREMETEQIMRIMLRKTKPNAILVGSAGCGKTAIVENLAYHITDSKIAFLRSKMDNERAKMNGEEYDEILPPLFHDVVIYDLDLASMVGGTKYRGDFEERLDALLHEVEKNPNIVLFIDEIHQLGEMGKAEGSAGMGQMLKPALARGTLRCIGATTDDEYKFVTNDKALSRRFNKVSILPLVGENAVIACGRIMADYEKHHGVAIENVTPAELYDMAQQSLKGSAFPDNIINLIDETMASARFERKMQVDKTDFQQTLSRLLSADVVSVKIGFGF